MNEDTSVLLKIETPGKVELRASLPASLQDGSVGGFQPCGMWDFLFDSASAEWCGVLFYLSEHSARAFQSANPHLDRVLVRLRLVSEAFDDPGVIDQCLENETSHVLEVTWAQMKKVEIMPAMESSDWWYGVVGDSPLATEDRLSPTHEFSAIGIMSVDSSLKQYGFKWPRKLHVPGPG